jgi:hypothetical protein
MTSLLRFLRNLVTFGLAQKLDNDTAREHRNLRRMAEGKPRLADPPTRDLADVLHVDPFWRNTKGPR